MSLQPPTGAMETSVTEEGNVTEKDPALERAERQVKVVRDFYYHLMVPG